jgi:hypothetical protein
MADLLVCLWRSLGGWRERGLVMVRMLCLTAPRQICAKSIRLLMLGHLALHAKLNATASITRYAATRTNQRGQGSLPNLQRVGRPEDAVTGGREGGRGLDWAGGGERASVRHRAPGVWLP